MSEIFDRIRSLVARGDYRVSLHGFRELAADNISLDQVVAGVQTAATLEEYTDTGRGPSVLVLQLDRNKNPLHIVWGIYRSDEASAVLVTAYRPDPKRWSPDFKRRRSQ